MLLFKPDLLQEWNQIKYGKEKKQNGDDELNGVDFDLLAKS